MRNIAGKLTVQKELDLQREVTQEFHQNIQQIQNEIGKEIDALNKQRENKSISDEEYDTQINRLHYKSVLLNSIAAGLSAPTSNIAGIAAATASPTLAYQIGQYFKNNAELNRTDGGNRPEQGSFEHIMAHAILGAAVAAAGGNDALAGATSAAGAEAAAPLLSYYLYGEKDPSELDSEQKQTIVAITSLAGTAVGVGIGNTTADAVSGNLNANSAVENNYLTPKQTSLKRGDLLRCFFYIDTKKCKQEITQKFDDISREQDEALAADCQQNPHGSSCNKKMDYALRYVGDARDDSVKQSDINQSRKRVLDVANNSGYSAINNLTKRANYFGAMYAYTNQPWFRAAEKVSREDLNIPNHLWYSKWIAEAGNVIMKNGYRDFVDVYINHSRYSNAWSENRLYKEQTDPELQRVHEKYYQQWKPWWGRPLADIKADGDFLNYRNRMKVGCSKMPDVEACKKWK